MQSANFQLSACGAHTANTRTSHLLTAPAHVFTIHYTVGENPTSKNQTQTR